MTKGQQAYWNDIPFVKYGRFKNSRVVDRMSKPRLSAIIAKRALIAAYNEENEPDTCIVDLLADLRHLCDALGYLDFADLDKQAYAHYAHEVVTARNAKFGHVSKNAGKTGWEGSYAFAGRKRKEVK